MANDFQPELRNGPDASVTSLVRGIVNDVQMLVKQQLDLFKHEVRSDFGKSKTALLYLGVGVLLLLGGLACLVVMLANLLNWATEIPLWGCYGLVGGVLLIVGSVLTWVGRQCFQSFNPLPDETMNALEENVQCLIQRK